MKVLLIDNGTTLLEKLKTLIPGAETIKKAEEFSSVEASKYDLLVLSGSSKEQLVGNESDFKSELEFIRSNQRPLIGICFGCELIVSAFGGELHKLETPHKGIKEIEMMQPEIFGGKAKISVYENHSWIMSEAPAGFEVLARSIDGPEMIRHKTLPIYGLQFHPENSAGQTEGDELFLSLLKTIEDRSGM